MFYIVSMNHNTTHVESAQGAEQQQIAEPNAENVQKWLTNDIGRCIKLLQTIHSNPTLLRMITDVFVGEIENHKNRLAQKPLNKE